MKTGAVLLVAVVLVLGGLLIGGVGLFQIIDPVGTKMADYNDPLGPPAARSTGLPFVLAGAAIGAAGVVLFIRRANRERS